MELLHGTVPDAHVWWRIADPSWAPPGSRLRVAPGRALEGLVAQHLRAWAAYARHDVDLFYWRTRAGAEVDFVVYGESGLQAFEVKNHRKVHATDLRALRAFRDDYPDAETAVLYRGSERLRIGRVLCLPIEEFLLGITPDRHLPT